MTRFNIFTRTVFVASLLNLSGCNYIASLFPDKEKDYQFTTEIPELVIPPDLGKNELPAPAAKNTVAAEITPQETPAPPVVEEPIQPLTPQVTPPAGNESEIVQTPVAEKPIEPVGQLENPVAVTSPTEKPSSIIPAEIIKSSSGTSQLHLGVPFEKAWRTVDKALSRRSIEVTRRDKEESLFSVQYDSEDKKLQDGSLWDEAVFIFSGFEGNEKQFLLKLVPTNGQTDVIVLDENKQPSTDASALSLLTRLLETIKADFVKN